MIAYHFPPLAGSSGIHRTLRFTKYLSEFGWKPFVLTTTTNAYTCKSSDQLPEIDPDCIVARAPAFDTARHLSFRGRNFSAMAMPDRWISWWPCAVATGLWMIARHRIAAIWSTYPIASAHRIAYSLHRLTGIPWIADFRDPMTQEGDPEDPRLWQSFKNIEEMVFRSASICTFTTPGAVRFYRQQYPALNEHLDQPHAIEELLVQFLRNPDENTKPDAGTVASSSRRGRTGEFAQLLDNL